MAAGPDAWQRPLDGVHRGGTRIGEWGGVQGIESVQPDEFSGGGDEHETGEAAVHAVPTTHRGVVAEAVLAADAPDATAAGPRRHHRHGIALGPTGDARTERGDMTADLVAEGERSGPAEHLGEYARDLGHADIGVAESVARDLHDDLARTGLGDRRFGEHRRLFPLDDPVGLHHVGHAAILPRTPSHDSRCSTRHDGARRPRRIREFK